MRRAVSGAVELSSGREPLRAGWLASAPAVLLAGVAQALSFAPFELWWLQLIAMAVLAHATAGSSPRRAGLMAVNRLGGLKSVFVSEAAGIAGDLPRLLRGERV